MPYRGMPVPPPRRDTPTPPQWPSYTGNSQFVGTSPNGKVNVYVDPTLGQPAMTNAQDLVNDADRVVTANDAIFGTPGGPVSVIVFALWDRTDGTGGADHMACDYVRRGPYGLRLREWRGDRGLRLVRRFGPSVGALRGGAQ